MSGKLYDVLVVGAGPAGTAAARAAASSQLKTLVVDPNPRGYRGSKACGGLISQRALALYENTGITLPDTIILDEISRFKIHPAPGTSFRAAEQHHRLGVTVHRQQLDRYLLKRAVSAGADFIKGRIQPSSISTGGGSPFTLEVMGQQPVHSRCIIAADGTFSPLAHQAGLRGCSLFFNKGYGLSIRTTSGISLKDRGRASFYFIPFPGGLGWLFPLRRGYNIGIGAWSIHKKQLFEYFPHFLGQVLQDRMPEGEGLPSPKAAYLPAGGLYLLPQDGAVLPVGDAAGFVNPFSGEGIYYAVKSALLAVRAVKKAEAGESPSARYARYCYQSLYPEFYRYLALCTALGRRSQPWMQTLLKLNLSSVFTRLFLGTANK